MVKSGDDAALEFYAQTWTHDYQDATVGFSGGVSKTLRSKSFTMACSFFGVSFGVTCLRPACPASDASRHVARKSCGASCHTSPRPDTRRT